MVDFCREREGIGAAMRVPFGKYRMGALDRYRETNGGDGATTDHAVMGLTSSHLYIDLQVLDVDTLSKHCRLRSSLHSPRIPQ